MNFGFTEEQDLLRSEVQKFLAQRCPLSEVRRIGEEQTGFCIKLWGEISELGWPGLAISDTRPPIFQTRVHMCSHSSSMNSRDV